MSREQQKTPQRVAAIPGEDFEAAVESENPPTVTALAAQGTQPRPLLDLRGRDPKDFARSTDGQGHVRRLVEFAERPGVIVTPTSWKGGAKSRRVLRLRRDAIEALLGAPFQIPEYDAPQPGDDRDQPF
jgi:hypothetical protein